MGAIPGTTLEAMWAAVAAGDPIYLALVDSSYTYSAAHDFFDDVSGVLGTPIEVTNPTFVGGVLDSPDRPFAYSGVLLGEQVTQAWAYINTGVDATSRLLVYIDRRADGSVLTPMITGDGTDIDVDWPVGNLASI